MNNDEYVARRLIEDGVKLPMIRVASTPPFIGALPPSPGLDETRNFWRYLPRRSIDMGDILEAVVRVTGKAEKDILGSSRSVPIVSARKLFYVLAVDQTGKSLTQIGRFVGKDHSTICSMVDVHGVRVRASEEYAAVVARLKRA